MKLSPESQDVISILTLIWYFIKDDELYKHLGVMFSNDCKWTKPIDKLIEKYSKHLNVPSKIKGKYLEKKYYANFRI